MSAALVLESPGVDEQGAGSHTAGDLIAERPTAGSVPVRRAGRPWLRPATPVAVIVTWAVAVTAFGLWGRVADGTAAAATMVFGSLVAGSTPQGGGAVAFPVFTKVLAVPAAAARTFSLSIQAVGMGTAAVLIVMRGLPVAWRAVRVIAPAAAVSFLLSLLVLTEAGPFRPSILPDDVAKVGFTVVIAALAVLTARLRHAQLRNVDVDLDRASVRALVLVGLLGGVLSALLGSGADVVAFLALTLLMGVRPGVAVPSSVVVMAVVSILGLLTLGLADGQLLAAGPTVDLPSLWLAAVPVVAVGAPLGSWLASKASDRLLLRVAVGLATAEVVTTVLFLDRLRMDPLLAIGAVVVGALIVRSLWAAYCRGHGAVVSDPVLARPSPFPSRSSRGTDMPARPTANAGVPVGGVRSRSGHLNHPRARYCHRTGQRLEGLVGPTTTGPRPTLGVLCVDDGNCHPLTVDLVVGRDPHRHHLVTDGRARALELADPSGSLSRSHLLVSLRGWDIKVADIGSRNGTWLRHDEDGPWVPVAAGEAVTVPSGSTLACGDRQLRIDHLHVR